MRNLICCVVESLGNQRICRLLNLVKDEPAFGSTLSSCDWLDIICNSCYTAVGGQAVLREQYIIIGAENGITDNIQATPCLTPL